MQPVIEVLPPEKPRLLLSGKKRKGWVDPSPSHAGPEDCLSLVAPRKAGRKSKYATREGQEKIQKAFEKYRDMGELRSLKKVAVELNLPPHDVSMWSIKYKWGNQIARNAPEPFVVVNKSLQDQLAEETLHIVKEVIPVIKLRLSTMTRVDPATGEKVLTENASASALKGMIDTCEGIMKNLERNVNRQKTEKEIQESGSGDNGKGSKPGTIVNFNILSLNP